LRALRAATQEENVLHAADVTTVASQLLLKFVRFLLLQLMVLLLVAAAAVQCYFYCL
jgi:hypothetical protein